jgi:hypothetical protein
VVDGLLGHVEWLLSSFLEVGPTAAMRLEVFDNKMGELTADFDSSSSLTFKALKWSPSLNM